MFFKVWRCRGEQEISSGEPDCPQVPETPYGVSGTMVRTCANIPHAQTYPKTRQIYIFSTYAPRESLFFLNITLTFSSQFVNFGLFGDNRRKGFCPCFINIFSISCIFLHLRPLRNIRNLRKIRNLRNPPDHPEPPEPSGPSGASAPPLHFPPLTLRQTAAAS